MMLLIRGGVLIDPETNSAGSADILIEDGKVKALGSGLSAQNAEVIEAEGLTVAPGLFDVHCHLREPGFEYKEDIKSGLSAAAKGGFTSVACMPNTRPVADNEKTLLYITEQARKASGVNVFPIAAITEGSLGLRLTDMEKLSSLGAAAFSDDGRPVPDASVMRRAMLRAKETDALIISHCEDAALSGKGVMNEGILSKKLGYKGVPGSSEEIIVAREAVLALETGARVHIAHVSTKTSVEIVRFAKAQGARLTCETCPHYFSLTEDSIEAKGALAKVNPPLRTEKDIEAVIGGLKDGTIDVIATDHAPHSKEEKLNLITAPSGFSGFETALSISLTYLNGRLTVQEIISKLTINPAMTLRRDKGIIREGKEADIVIFDPEAVWEVDGDQFLSKGKNTPYNGVTLKGKVVYTIAKGNVIYKG
ncbi:MAG: dihydroorotase [Bacillota bacterium]|nr:dihydroorotase [Bacillota bacterium]